MKNGKFHKGKPEYYTKWIKTNENWHPSYAPKEDNNPLNHDALEVSFMKLSDGLYRCCVWGADDFGLEFDHKSRIKVLERYNNISDFTLKSDLQGMGFISC